MSLYQDLEVGNGASYPQQFTTEFGSERHWQAIARLQQSPDQKKKWMALLYNSLLTERRQVFMLSRAGFARLLKNAFRQKPPNGQAFGAWRKWMLLNGYIRELRPPQEEVGQRRGGLYELTDPDVLAPLETIIGQATMAKLRDEA